MEREIISTHLQHFKATKLCNVIAEFIKTVWVEIKNIHIYLPFYYKYRCSYVNYNAFNICLHIIMAY